MNDMAKSKKSKWLWARNGAVFGIIIALSDILLEWRGPLYYPWDAGPGFIAHNVGQLISVAGLPALIGFALGAVRDRGVSSNH